MKIYQRIISIILCLLTVVLCVSFVACKDDEKPPIDDGDKVTITLNKTECTYPVDEEFYLEATTNGKGIVTWTSSDRTVVSVDSNGRVLTKKVGTATIIATVGEVSATCKVNVTERSNDGGAEIRVEAECFLSLAEGAVKLQAQYAEEGNVKADKQIAYSSTNEAVVTVSADGTLTPVALGTAVVELSCDNVKASVVVDVYTAAIATPSDWLAMITNSGHYPDKIKPNDRYYLKNDIDFTGVEYDIGYTAVNASDEKSGPYHFASEINGNFHSVKNITQWKVDPDKNPENDQSIFGRTIGATVRNIAFENVVFNSANSYGLSSVMMHHFSDMSSIGSISNLFENVNADFVYNYDATDGKGNLATGITARAYGTNLKNVFVRMRTADGSLLTDKYNEAYGFARAEWVWYGGSLANVITLMENMPMGEAQFINDGAGDQTYKHLKSNCYAVNTLIQAMYYANQCFDQSVWNVNDPLNVPTFR